MAQHLETSPVSPRRPEARRSPVPGESGGASGPILIARRPSAEGPSKTTTVYTESNNPAAGQNAVLAFRQTASGALTEIGSFNTEGTGQNNFPTIVPGLPGSFNLGPDDTSGEVVATPNGRLLFAVNQGSDSVSSFRIGWNGRDHFGRHVWVSGGAAGQPRHFRRHALRVQPRRCDDG